MRCPNRGLCIALLAGLAALAGCDARSPLGNPATQREEAIPSKEVGHGALRFVEGYVRGYEQARREGKPMLVFFTVEGCGYCEETVREASADEDVVRLSGKFVCILVDADLEPEICRDFRVRGYPTIQFMSPQGVPLNRLMGKTAPRQLALQMQAALQATASRVQYIRQTAVR